MRILEASVNVVLLIAGVMLCIRLGSGWISRGTGSRPSAAAVIRASHDVGLLGKTVKFRPQGKRGGVVAVLSKTCLHCTESIPFYRSLSQELRRTPLQFSIAMRGTKIGRAHV